MVQTLNIIDAPPMPPYHVILRFGPGVPTDAQGAAMLHLEKELRQSTGLPVEVFKEYLKDDLKRRSEMTPEQRDRL